MTEADGTPLDGKGAEPPDIVPLKRTTVTPPRMDPALEDAPCLAVDATTVKRIEPRLDTAADPPTARKATEAGSDDDRAQGESRASRPDRTQTDAFEP
jgi:hypothetical protein